MEGHAPERLVMAGGLKFTILYTPWFGIEELTGSPNPSLRGLRTGH